MKNFKSLISLILIGALLASCAPSATKQADATAPSSVQETEVETTSAPKINYPRVDGSTANMPMMAMIRSHYTGESLEEAENNTATFFLFMNHQAKQKSSLKRVM